MLSRETCEALAKAYPEEIGGHEMRPFDVVVEAVVNLKIDGTSEEIEHFFPFGPVSGRLVGAQAWHPRLEDLLAVAVKVADSVEDATRMGRLGLCLFDELWVFSPGLIPESVNASGGTPEGAVAAWLLAVAEAKKGA